MRRAESWKGWRSSRLKCGCMGYHFPHRKGGGACDFSPRKDYYCALRAGVPQAEAMLLLSVAHLEEMFPLPEDCSCTP